MKKIELPKLTLVLGGAASGKSAFAETLVVQSDSPKVYIATAQAYDAEMSKKIALHKTRRGADWATHEAPYTPWDVFAKASPNDVILLDCVTLWLSNILLADQDLDQAHYDLINGLTSHRGTIVVVSNETGQGIVPENALARRFRQEQGRLNQRLAALADVVVFVAAGLPFALKGMLPQVNNT